MNGQIKISIIMPSLNVCAYISECIESVIDQTIKDIEVICIDAGSIDGTAEILQKYANIDSRIRLFQSEIKSYGYQINKGIEMARGEYIGIVETDDYIDRTMYEIMYNTAVAAMKPDVVKAGYYNIWNDSRGIEKVLKIDEDTGSTFPLSSHYNLLSGHPSVWSCIYKKSFLDSKKIRMLEVPGAGWVDNPWLFKTLCEAESITWVNEALYYYRLNTPGSSSILKNCSIPIDRLNDIKDYLEEYYPDNRQLEEILATRTIIYIRSLLKNPNYGKEERKKTIALIFRFRQPVMLKALYLKHTKSIKNRISRLIKHPTHS